MAFRTLLKIKLSFVCTYLRPSFSFLTSPPDEPVQRREKMKTSEAEKILNNEYGVGVVVAPTCAVLWAVEKCANPAKELSIINKIKAKHGSPLAYAPYGHIAF